MIDRLKLTGYSMFNKMAQMEIISNNLANISTNGFKRNKIFENELSAKLKSYSLSQLNSKVHIPNSSAVIDFSQGSLVGSNRPLDVAISGNGLFAVETPQGEVYTRDGRFTLNQEGILTTLDGYVVLGEGGPIEIELQQNSPSQIIINEKGEILIDGNVLDRLKVFSLENPQNFNKIGSNLFQLKDSTISLNPAENYTIKQGFLEESNVNPILEMVAMIEVSHFYQTGRKLINTQDSLLGRAVNDIGRVS
ncbi:MAG: flagellar hook-basal body protein [bacterium]